MTVDS